jgi:hypothetical protein
MSVASLGFHKAIFMGARDCRHAGTRAADGVSAILLATTARLAAFAPGAEGAHAWREARMSVAFGFLRGVRSMLTFRTSILSLRTDQEP